MKKRKIQLIILFSSIALVGLITSQTFWVINAYKQSEKQFDHRANMALHDAVKELYRDYKTCSYHDAKKEFQNALKENQNNIYDVIDTTKLKESLKKYVDFHELDNHFEFAIVKNNGDSIIYCSNQKVCSQMKEKAHKSCLSCLWNKQKLHLAMFFPGKSKYLIFDMLLWLSLSALFLITVIFIFTYIIHSIIRQKKISEMKNDFINNMTHEFKTPISTISLAAEVLLDLQNGSGDERIKKYSNIIYDENIRMQNQVDKVLHAAQLEKGNYELDKEPIDLHELIQNTIHNLCLEECDNPSVIQYKLNAKNPIIRADMMHLTNVINNLVENAVKYSMNEPEIIISTRNNDIGILLFVSDKGIGMNHDTQKQIFEKFYRTPTGNVHTVKGFGLGLYYVKSIIDSHKGSIKVKSELNKGSVFEVFLPF